MLCINFFLPQILFCSILSLYFFSPMFKHAIHFLSSLTSSPSFCIHHLISFSSLLFLFTLFLPPPSFSVTHSFTHHFPLLFGPFPLSLPFFLQPAPLRSPLPSVFPAHVSSKLPQGVGQIRPTDKSHQLYRHQLDSPVTHGNGSAVTLLWKTSGSFW